MTTTVDAAAPTARVPYSVRTRLVLEARPDLIKAMEKAGEAYYQHDEEWQAEVDRQQRAGGMPKRDLESPYRRALREAAAAVVEKSKELLAEGI